MHKHLMRALILAQLVASLSSAQVASIGNKGGAPLIVGPESSNCCANTTINPYTFGLAGEVRLPSRFAFEADMLLQRLHTNYSTFGHPAINPDVGVIGRVSGYTWNFPLLVKYYPTHLRFRPYFEAGPTIRHVGHLHGEGISYAVAGLAPFPAIVSTPVTIDSDPDKDYSVGITAGGGVSFNARVLRISPEVRYTRWTDNYLQPTRNQVEILLGITFPASR
jgi:hypothetical protein